jgi:hypothetical protein
VIGVVIGTALVSGCAEKQEASDTLPSPSASPTTEALPEIGPADFPVPDEARTKDAAGAEAFLRYYIELINRTSDVMDAEPLREFSNGCSDCDRIADATEEAAAAGNDYEGGAITITEVGQPILSEVIAEIPIRIDQAAFIVRDATGAPIEGGSPPYSDVLGGAALAWNAERTTWFMTDLTFQ